MGRAAFSICESLLLTLLDRGLLKTEDVVDALEDAAAAHRNANGSAEHREREAAAAQVIEALIGNLPSMQQGQDTVPKDNT